MAGRSGGQIAIIAGRRSLHAAEPALRGRKKIAPGVLGRRAIDRGPLFGAGSGPSGCGGASGPALQQPGPATAALGTQPGSAAGFARLLVILATAHFLLDSTAFDELAETANRFLDRFAIPHIQLNHMSSFYVANGPNRMTAMQGQTSSTQPAEPMNIRPLASSCPAERGRGRSCLSPTARRIDAQNRPMRGHPCRTLEFSASDAKPRFAQIPGFDALPPAANFPAPRGKPGE